LSLFQRIGKLAPKRGLLVSSRPPPRRTAATRAARREAGRVIGLDRGGEQSRRPHRESSNHRADPIRANHQVRLQNAAIGKFKADGVTPIDEVGQSVVKMERRFAKHDGGHAVRMGKPSADGVQMFFIVDNDPDAIEQAEKLALRVKNASFEMLAQSGPLEVYVPHGDGELRPILH
jgi:hypothetical protein